MKLLLVLLFIFSGVAVISIRYRIAKRIKLTNPENKYLKNYGSLLDLFPMAIKNRPLEDIADIKKANIALIIFYLCVLINFILVYFIKYCSTC